MQRRTDAIALAALVLGVLALYLPPGLFVPGHSLLGIDFNTIHDRRIHFVQEHFAEHGLRIPGWYPRELMGTPFWSNVQSFPFLPTRLVLLWIPHDLLFPVAVNLAAILAAVFTYLFLRKLSLGRLAAVAGAWTFVASGFFASRVMAGHLPLLEAYAALPLLLWLVECLAQAEGRWSHYLALTLASLCIVLSGHPQIPTYAMAAAAFYALVRGPRKTWTTTFAAMASAVGLSGFVWWPMLRLIGRSTRILPLDPPGNDLALPYWRLKSFFLPWADGWPSIVPRVPAKAFVATDGALFWDTVCYVGWVPWIAAAFLAERAIRQRRLPEKRYLLLATIGIGALVLALPFAREITSELRVTLLRSPSRLLYLTTFALSAATAVAIDVVARARFGAFRHAGTACAVAILGLHAIDLGRHDEPFVDVSDRPAPATPEFEVWRRSVGDRRCAFDYVYWAPANRTVDDVGFFDSIMLARPYRAFTSLAGERPGLNVQNMDGSALPLAALAGLCAQLVVTDAPRKDLSFQQQLEYAAYYLVPDPSPRASFVPDDAVTFLEDDLVLVRFWKGIIELQKRMFLAPSARPAAAHPPEAGQNDAPADARVEYQRPDPDEIVLRVENARPGYARVIESWDEGWSATLDGSPAELLVADTFAMAVRLPPGRHEVRFTFRTPGARTGLWISVASATFVLLLLLRLRVADRRAAAEGPV